MLPDKCQWGRLRREKWKPLETIKLSRVGKGWKGHVAEWGLFNRHFWKYGGTGWKTCATTDFLRLTKFQYVYEFTPVVVFLFDEFRFFSSTGFPGFLGARLSWVLGERLSWVLVAQVFQPVQRSTKVIGSQKYYSGYLRDNAERVLSHHLILDKKNPRSAENRAGGFGKTGET